MEKEKADSCELSTDQILFLSPRPHFPRVPKIFINYRTHHPLSLGISSLLAAILAWQGAGTKTMLSMSLEHLEAAWPELLTASATPRGSAITTSTDLGMALKSFSKVPLGAALSASGFLSCPELTDNIFLLFPNPVTFPQPRA